MEQTHPTPEVSIVERLENTRQAEAWRHELTERVNQLRYRDCYMYDKGGNILIVSGCRAGLSLDSRIFPGQIFPRVNVDIVIDGDHYPTPVLNYALLLGTTLDGHGGAIEHKIAPNGELKPLAFEMQDDSGDTVIRVLKHQPQAQPEPAAA